MTELDELYQSLNDAHGITHEEDLFARLDEAKQIADFPQTALDLRQRAQQEGLRLVFHVFADGTDDFIHDPLEVLALYQQHRNEGEPNVRLWYELVQDCQYDDESHDHGDDGTMEENHMIGYGNYPM